MAAKRHHQSVKDRLAESRGMEKRMLGEGYYEGLSGRRHQEMMDAGMIREDHSAVANLPQQVIMREYPKTYGYSPEGLDDTIRGVDGQIDLDNSKKWAHLKPKKV